MTKNIMDNNAFTWGFIVFLLHPLYWRKPKYIDKRKYMHGNANSDIFKTLLKSVTSPCDEKHKQTVATLVV